MSKSLVSILLMFGGYHTIIGQSMSQHDFWLQQNVNFISSYKNQNRLIYSTRYEKDLYNPDISKLIYAEKDKRSEWIHAYSFRWSDIERCEVSYLLDKKPTLYKVKVKLISKNSMSLITRTLTAKGNAIVGKNTMNGSINENFYSISVVVSAFPDEASAIRSMNKFDEVLQKIVALNK